MINIIAIVDRDRAIGYQNRLIYNIPEDLIHFKQLTMGHAVIMGRKTFESLPNGALPGRRNIIVSRNIDTIDGAEVYESITEALNACRNEEEIFIIGGAEIYRQTINIAGRLYLTIVDKRAQAADAWFPPYDGWKLKEKKQNEGFAFCMYEAPLPPGGG